VVVSYPPEPWYLTGHAYVGLFLVPRDVAPPPHSPATRAITVLGRTVVCAAFFVYEPPSPLTYGEIMSTVLVRQGWRPRVSITHIWVDSEASRDGGRELWAIPKDLATFDIATHETYAARGIAGLSLGRVRRLRPALPLGFSLAQDREGVPLVSPVTGRATIGVARGHWSFTPDGPLSFLAGRRPLLTVAVRPFRLVFGRR
jgi:hypothetical protein